MNRLKNKIVWTSIFSLLLIIFGSFGVYEKIGITEEKFQIAIDSFLSILVILGILNDPTLK